MKTILDLGRFWSQQRSHRLTVLPIVILYLNDVCNSRCVTCAIWENNERLKAPELRSMSDALLDELYKWLDQWRPSQVLLSGGEPTMHPQFSNIVRRLKAQGAKVVTITNGLLLRSYDKADLNQIAEYYISYDAPDRELYRTIRGVDGFAQLAESMKILKALTPQPPLVARCTLQRENVGRVVDIVKSARAMGFDQISFLAVDLFSEAFARHRPDHSVKHERIQPRETDLSEFVVGIENLDRMQLSGFIEGGTERLRKLLQYFNAVLEHGDFPVVGCNAPWFSVVVETTGAIRGCFFHRVIGDFRNINGPEAVSFRQVLDVRNDPICRRCVCNKKMTNGNFLRL